MVVRHFAKSLSRRAGGRKHKVFRCILHLPVGIGIVLFVLIHPVISALLFSGFMIYELNEDYHLKDEAYIDIFGMLFGMAIAGAIWLAVKFS